MQELEITWKRAMAVWWLLLWRASIGGGIMGMVAGFIGGFIGGLIGWSPEVITVVGAVLGWIIGLVWSAFVVRMALRKKYGDFRLALVPRTAA